MKKHKLIELMTFHLEFGTKKDQNFRAVGSGGFRTGRLALNPDKVTKRDKPQHHARVLLFNVKRNSVSARRVKQQTPTLAKNLGLDFGIRHAEGSR